MECLRLFTSHFKSVQKKFQLFVDFNIKKKMLNKKNKKSTTKKIAKKEIFHTLKLDNDVEIPANTKFMRNSKHFNTSDIDIIRIIRVCKAL